MIMKSIKTGITTVILLMASVAFSAIPQTINYQGYLTNSSGSPITGRVSVVFSLYTGTIGGIARWTETQGAVTVTNGVFSVQLGSVTAFTTNLFNRPLYLGVKVGTDPEMTPRSRLSTAPYAFHAESAASLTGNKYYSISPMEIHPESDAARWLLNETELRPLSRGVYYAPVHLPDGSVVKSLSAVLLRRPRSTQVARVILRRRPVFNITNSTTQSMASVTYPNISPSGYRLGTDTRVQFATIDNGRYVYYLRIDITATGGGRFSGFSSTAFRGARIAYK